jgi:hypothetical protein
MRHRVAGAQQRHLNYRELECPSSYASYETICSLRHRQSDNANLTFYLSFLWLFMILLIR